jgi:hypothetical protein
MTSFAQTSINPKVVIINYFNKIISNIFSTQFSISFITIIKFRFIILSFIAIYLLFFVIMSYINLIYLH